MKLVGSKTSGKMKVLLLLGGLLVTAGEAMFIRKAVENVARELVQDNIMDQASFRAAPGDNGNCGLQCPNTNYEKEEIDHTVEFISRVGLGENTGLPGMSFLGLGYHVFEGNPRGEDGTELDPGFRHRVIELKQDQNNNTLDLKYLLPLGAAIRDGISCEFSSSSAEISTQEEYRDELSKEATQTKSYTASVGGSSGAHAMTASSSGSFSKSKGFSSFTEEQTKEQTVTYEAKARCTESIISFEPYYDKELHKSVTQGLDSLSEYSPYDGTITEVKEKYENFFKMFGTHFITKVVLGAKYIQSSHMKSKDVMELKRKRIDVKKSMSLSFSGSYSYGLEGEEAAAPQAKDKDDSKPDKTYKFIFEGYREAAGCPDTCEPPREKEEKGEKPEDSKKSLFGGASSGLGVQASGSYSESESSSKMSEKESRKQAQEKVTKTTEINIGGTPPADGDWKTWAASVSSRPMPISYEYEGIWTMLEEGTQQQNDTIKALLDIYGFDVAGESRTNIILKQLHFGVFEPNGLPISPYSSTTNKNYRSLLQAEYIPIEASASSSEEVGVWDRKDHLNGMDIPDYCMEGYNACGAEIWYGDEDRKGIYLMSLLCCTALNPETWNSPLPTKISGEPCGSSADKACGKDDQCGKCKGGTFYDTCSTGKFITAMDVLVCNEGTHPESGIRAVKFLCQEENPGTDSHWLIKPIIGSDCGADSRDSGWTGWKPELPDDNLVVRGGGTAYYSGNENGVRGLKIYMKPLSGGIQHDTYQYQMVWEGSSSFVSAYLASVVRGDIVPSLDEDSSGKPEEIMSGLFSPYGLLSTQDPSRARILISRFKDSFSNSDVNALSVVTADDLPNNSTFTAGVVHPRGFVVNQVFGSDSSYEVIKENEHELALHFTDESSDYTLLLFPLWFSDSDLPSNVGETAVATRKCLLSKCSIALGAMKSKDEYLDTKKNLGFSFLYLNADAPGVIHGTIEVEVNSDNSTVTLAKTNGYGFKEDDIRADFNFSVDDKSEEGTPSNEVVGGGVLIKFSKPFQAVPAIYVSPIIGDDRKLKYSINLDENNGVIYRSFNLPFAMVEHVTTKQTFVRVGYFSNGNEGFTPLSFSFIAVGPPAEYFSA